MHGLWRVPAGCAWVVAGVWRVCIALWRGPGGGAWAHPRVCWVGGCQRHGRPPGARLLPPPPNLCGFLPRLLLRPHRPSRPHLHRRLLRGAHPDPKCMPQHSSPAGDRAVTGVGVGAPGRNLLSSLLSSLALTMLQYNQMYSEARKHCPQRGVAPPAIGRHRVRQGRRPRAAPRRGPIPGPRPRRARPASSSLPRCRAWPRTLAPSGEAPMPGHIWGLSEQEYGIRAVKWQKTVNNNSVRHQHKSDAHSPS